MFLRSLRTASAVTAAIAICVVVVIEWIGMFGRYFGASTPWIAEALNLATFWLIWPAVVLAQFKGAHYVVDLFGNHLPRRVRVLRDTMLDLVILGYSGLVSYYALSSLAGPGRTLTYLSPLTHDWEIVAIPVGLIGIMILVSRDLLSRRPGKRSDNASSIKVSQV